MKTKDSCFMMSMGGKWNKKNRHERVSKRCLQKVCNRELSWALGSGCVFRAEWKKLNLQWLRNRWRECEGSVHTSGTLPPPHPSHNHIPMAAFSTFSCSAKTRRWITACEHAVPLKISGRDGTHHRFYSPGNTILSADKVTMKGFGGDSHGVSVCVLQQGQTCPPPSLLGEPVLKLPGCTGSLQIPLSNEPQSMEH